MTARLSSPKSARHPVDVRALKGAPASVLLVIILEHLLQGVNAWRIGHLMRETGYQKRDVIREACTLLSTPPRDWLVCLGAEGQGGELVYGLSGIFPKLDLSTELSTSLRTLPAERVALEGGGSGLIDSSTDSLKPPPPQIETLPAGRAASEENPSHPDLQRLVDLLLSRFPCPRRTAEERLAAALEDDSPARVEYDLRLWCLYCEDEKHGKGLEKPGLWITRQLYDRVRPPRWVRRLAAGERVWDSLQQEFVERATDEEQRLIELESRFTPQPLPLDLAEVWRLVRNHLAEHFTAQVYASRPHPSHKDQAVRAALGQAVLLADNLRLRAITNDHVAHLTAPADLVGLIESLGRAALRQALRVATRLDLDVVITPDADQPAYLEAR